MYIIYNIYYIYSIKYMIKICDFNKNYSWFSYISWKMECDVYCSRNRRIPEGLYLKYSVTFR